MTSSSYLKLGTLGAIFIFLPFLTGILIGKVSDSLLAEKASYKPISALTSPKQTTPAQQNEAVAIAEPVETPTPPAEPAQTIPTPPPSQPKPATPKAAVAGVNTSTVKTEPAATCNGNLQNKFLCLLNEYRAKKNLGKLTMNSKLSAVALDHSSWMNQTGIFSHIGINNSRMFDRCAAAGTQCLAENLAEGILDANKLLNSWIANPSHNKNLLGNYTVVGFGQSGDYVTLLLN